jgi:murein DD-endopeptidase MepM/ murein hydrolase activator NlpD
VLSDLRSNPHSKSRLPNPTLLLTLPLLFTSAVSYACLEFSAPLQQGALVWAKVAADSRVSLDGENLDVLGDGTVIMGFGRDAKSTAELSVKRVGSASGAMECSQTLAIAGRDYQIQRVEGVPAQTVNPPPERLARIRREGAMVSSARRGRLERPDLIQAAVGGFRWPVEGPVSGVYGSQRYYNGEPGRPHYGVDVAVSTGTVVRAPAAGVVTLAEPDLFYSGGTIILDHGYRLSSTFLHLSKVRVEAGTEVKVGDILGEVGSTGRATGPHLDWRMNWRDRRVDPQLLVPPMPKP